MAQISRDPCKTTAQQYTSMYKFHSKAEIIKNKKTTNYFYTKCCSLATKARQAPTTFVKSLMD